MGPTSLADVDSASMPGAGAPKRPAPANSAASGGDGQPQSDTRDAKRQAAGAPATERTPIQECRKAAATGTLDAASISSLFASVLCDPDRRGNTVAHLAARHDHAACLRAIAREAPQLLYAANKRGECARKPVCVASRVDPV